MGTTRVAERLSFQSSTRFVLHAGHGVANKARERGKTPVDPCAHLLPLNLVTPRLRYLVAFCSHASSQRYGWAPYPAAMTLHRHVLKRILKADTTATTYPIRSSLNRENPAKAAVMASKRKVVALQ